MSLRKIFRKELVYCGPASTIWNVAKLMKERDVGSVLVTVNGKPKGIVTDRDLVLRGIVEKRNVETCGVSEVMTNVVETISEDEGVYALTEQLMKAAVRRIVVVDSLGNSVGLLSFDDVFELITEEMNHLREAISSRHSKLSIEAA